MVSKRNLIGPMLTGLMLLGLCGSTQAELKPAEVFLVYNRNVPASGDLARYYAAKRGIPANQSIGLDLSDRDEIPREGYVQKIRDPLRAWLRHEGLQDRIKCIVTFYGVPLRVGKAGALPGERPLARNIDDEFDAAVQQLEAISADLARLVGEPPASQPATRPDGKPDLVKIVTRYEGLRGKAIERQRTIRDPSIAQASPVRLKELLEQGEGVVPLLSMLQSTDPAGQQMLAQVNAQAQQDVKQARTMLKTCPRSLQRQEGHKLLQRLYGLRVLVEHLQQDKSELDGNETQASLDSELSLLWWDDYPLFRWLLNPMCLHVRHDPEFRAKVRQDLVNQPVVMVARLDAPKTAIVRRMIDDALATEQQGLTGQFYIDARGLKPDKDSYGQYDEFLRDLARLVKAKTPLPLVLDDKSELFAAGTCPDAALYCGWYSLGKYVNAFKWNRGSIAWHIASSEAVSLRNPEAQYWCKRMLEEGVCATLGPVAEPYLTSFPPPHQFFGLLLTGRYTLVECYYLTNNFNSWMQTLLGDPLYNPYKGRSQLKPEDAVPAEWLAAPATTPAVASGH